MKILHINEKGIWHFGGGEKYLLDICNDLEKLGHENVIISSLTWLKSNPSVIDWASQRNTIELNSFIQGYPDIKLLVRNDNRKEYLIENYPGFRNWLKIIDNFKKVIQWENPDVVNIHGVQGFLNPIAISAIHRLKPTVQFIHYVGTFCLNGQKILASQNQICNLPMGVYCFKKGCYSSGSETGFLQSLKNIGVKFCILSITKKLDKIIVGSKYMHSQLLKNGFSEKRIAVIPCYTDKIASGLGSFTDENLILFIGRLHHTKGIYQLIRSLNLIGDIKWQAEIIGEGEEMDNAIYLTRKLGLDDRIHFVGKIAFDMVNSYYERCVLVVMASMIPESFGLVGIEAMAFGKPVVAFDVGGVTEWLIHNKTGFLIERGDIQKLAQRIAQLLDDKALAFKLGNAGQRRVTKFFRKDQHIAKLMAIYEEVIER